ncbi:hypothetical protein PFISCL1PPCAC_29043 [Pristionchus fissidentatus]|uniref:Nuclear receptor n=1 Tax=Pristionchus fissidentatus TaxID=1538716 RepID=A0AAV5X2G4_9BILA|nr:hypothetical protein PFISCL1PPCAC_16398 [Pristionchus fissidentatus]GMT37746.1 hypothetical protein PFISCL1PPCAC_29043 [Pristionchus fissidentatus]
MLTTLPSNSGQSSSSSTSSEGCAVCGDKVNGNRYGVPACLGCIVFFRRAIIKQSTFNCQRNGRCEIDHKSRCTCRFCRLQKCLLVGMNPNSIQRRDMMGPRKKRVKEEEMSPEGASSFDLSPRPPSLPLSVSNGQNDQLISLLSKLQEHQRGHHRSWFTAGGPHAPDPSFIDGIRDLDSLLSRRWGVGVDPYSFHFPPPPHSLHAGSPTSSSSTSSSNSLEDINWTGLLRPKEEVDDYYLDKLRRARKQDINVMFHLAITDSSEWGGKFPIFDELPIIYKRELLKEYAIGFMLVDQGYNTSKQNDDTLWILQHDKVYMCTDYMHGLPKQDQILPQAETKAKLHPDFVLECISTVGSPMRDMQIELYECVILKSLLLFECFNVYPKERRGEIANIRERIITSLAAYEAVEHPHDGIERIGTLLLMISNIRNCILVTCRQLHCHDVFSLMKFEPLVADVLLNRDDVIGNYV